MRMDRVILEAMGKTRSGRFNLCRLFGTVFLLGLLALCCCNNNATQYCPISHKLIWDYNCRITDSADGKILVEHHDVASDKLQLSIHGKGETGYIQHPYASMDNLSPKLDTNIIKFNPTRKNYLLVNGQDFKIEFLQH